MKKLHTTIYLSLMGAFLFQAAAFAETVQGTITKVDAAGSAISIHRTGEDKQNLPDELNIKVDRDAKYKNIASLNDLKRDNEVKLNVKLNKGLQVWEAKSIELINPANVNASSY